MNKLQNVTGRSRANKAYRFRTVLFLTAMAGCSATGLALADHYRWQDEQGNTILSDRPPPGGTEHEVISSPSSGPSPDYEEATDPEDATAVEGQEQSSQEPGAEEPVNTKAELCERARINLERLSGSDTISVRNDQDEVRELSADEVLIEQKTAEAQVSVYCKEEEES